MAGDGDLSLPCDQNHLLHKKEHLASVQHAKHCCITYMHVYICDTHHLLLLYTYLQRYIKSCNIFDFCARHQEHQDITIVVWQGCSGDGCDFQINIQDRLPCSKSRTQPAKSDLNEIPRTIMS